MRPSQRLADLLRALQASADPTALNAFAATLQRRESADDAIADEPAQTAGEIVKSAGAALIAQAGVTRNEALYILLK